MSSTLNELLTARASASPNATAYRTFILGLWESTTWAGLAAEVSRTASGLAALGVGDGSVVLISAENSPAWVVSALAVSQLGATTLAVPPDVTFEQMDQILGGVGVRVCIAGDEEQLDKVTDVSADVVVVVIDTRGVRSLDHDSRVDAMTRMTYAQLQALSSTSGASSSTTSALLSTPHHIALRTPSQNQTTHAELVAQGRSIAGALQAGLADRLHSQRNLADPKEFVASIVLPLVSGSEVTFGSIGSVGLLVREMGVVRPTLVHGSPTWLSAISADIADRSSKTRLFRKAALSAGWKPKAPERLPMKPGVPTTRIFGIVSAALVFVLLLISTGWKSGIRFAVLLALLAVIGLAMILTGSSVVDPLRRRYGVDRVRAVFDGDDINKSPGAATLGGLHVPLVDVSSVFSDQLKKG